MLTEQEFFNLLSSRLDNVTREDTSLYTSKYYKYKHIPHSRYVANMYNDIEVSFDMNNSLYIITVEKMYSTDNNAYHRIGEEKFKIRFSRTNDQVIDPIVSYCSSTGNEALVLFIKRFFPTYTIERNEIGRLIVRNMNYKLNIWYRVEVSRNSADDFADPDIIVYVNYVDNNENFIKTMYWSRARHPGVTSFYNTEGFVNVLPVLMDLYYSILDFESVDKSTIVPEKNKTVSDMYD